MPTIPIIANSAPKKCKTAKIIKLAIVEKDKAKNKRLRLLVLDSSIQTILFTD